MMPVDVYTLLFFAKGYIHRLRSDFDTTLHSIGIRV
jgi:hypothetical protein